MVLYFVSDICLHNFIVNSSKSAPYFIMYRTPVLYSCYGDGDVILGQVYIKNERRHISFHLNNGSLASVWNLLLPLKEYKEYLPRHINIYLFSQLVINENLI